MPATSTTEDVVHMQTAFGTLEHTLDNVSVKPDTKIQAPKTTSNAQVKIQIPPSSYQTLKNRISIIDCAVQVSLFYHILHEIETPSRYDSLEKNSTSQSDFI